MNTLGRCGAVPKSSISINYCLLAYIRWANPRKYYIHNDNCRLVS